MEDVLFNLLTSAGGITPAIMAYFMFKQNQLLIKQKDKYEEQLLVLIKELINERDKSRN